MLPAHGENGEVVKGRPDQEEEKHARHDVEIQAVGRQGRASVAAVRYGRPRGEV